jgi:multidrug efflux pump subunit AcrA (membrane-fusion protein)
MKKEYVFQSGSSSPYELRSSEVQDIMSKMPHWIVRKGITLLFVLILLLLAGAYFLHFPDVIPAKVVITSANPPVKLIAPSSGKVQQLFIANKQIVTPQQVIGIIENTAAYTEIIVLKNWLQRADTANNIAAFTNLYPTPPLARLGDLQSGYVDLQQAATQYNFFLQNNFYAKKEAQYQSQITLHQQQKKYVQSDMGYANKELALEKKRYKRDSILLKQKVISMAEFETRNTVFLSQQRSNNTSGNNMVQTQLAQLEQQKAITDLQQQKLKEENNLVLQLKDHIKRLSNQINHWEFTYLIKSPVQGQAIFFKFWKENQYVTHGETFVTIVPPVSSYVVKATLPIQGAGKVTAGNKALIKLTAYPFQEFGIIRGKVTSVSSIAIDTAFSVEISLSNGLTTNINKKLPLQPEYLGTAEILTDEKNILQRLFEKIWVSNKQ